CQLNCDPTSRVSGATSSRAQSVESRPDLESLIRSMQEEWQQRQQEWLQMSAAREADWQQREAAREAEWKQRYEQLENKVAKIEKSNQPYPILGEDSDDEEDEIQEEEEESE
ncbi:hypothetical protein LINGRAHAP2_LOCUS20368, partial [Linum grandiflorum]